MAFLNINKNQNKNLVKSLDKENYMTLGKPTSRLELFNFALALGVKEGSADISVPLQNKDSFIRDEYIGNERFLYSALYFDECEIRKHSEKIDEVIDDSLTFQAAEKYAEAGFDILKDYMKQYGELPFCYKLLEEMDRTYQKIKDEVPKEHIGIEYDEEESSIHLVADDSQP